MIAVNLSMNDDMVCSGCVVNQEKTKEIDWEERKEKFWKWMEKYSQNLYQFHILGGEPMYIPEFEETLEFFKTKKHSKREAARTTTTVNGKSLIRLPNLPPINIMPLKANMVVIVAVKTGMLILIAPFSAAS